MVRFVKQGFNDQQGAKKSFILIGKTPPPVGGVRVHFSRLIKELEKFDDLSFNIVPLTLVSLFTSFRQLLNAKFIHLHTSNCWVRFWFVFFCKMFFKKLIITYHGNLGRFGFVGNILDLISIRLAYLPITLNKKSLAIAKKYNKNSMLISAFIPPDFECIECEERLCICLEQFKQADYKYVFCSNAYGVTYDKYGQEIYGISELVRLFASLPEFGLIVSDPSGRYAKFFADQNVELTSNILLLNFSHSFLPVLKASDCFIRATTTDGDSLSIYEALWLGKSVIASDCVERPQGCQLFLTTNFEELKRLVLQFQPGNNNFEVDFYSGLNNLLEIYRNELRKTS